MPFFSPLTRQPKNMAIINAAIIKVSTKISRLFYCRINNEVQRFNGKTLKELQAHSAAESQTGSIGDINADGTIFEAVEVKHDIPITVALIDSAKQKIRGSQVERYYILSTYKDHNLSDELLIRQ